MSSETQMYFLGFRKKLIDITENDFIEGEYWLTYRLRSLITGLVYHGQCKVERFVIRMNQHKKANKRKGAKEYTKFYKAIREQGSDNWEVEITGFQENRQEADDSRRGYLET